MADDTIAFLDAVVGEPAHLAGCSDGAIVALLVALQRPDLIRKLVFMAGVFHRDGWESGVIDPDNTPPAFLERFYGELSPDGPEHYPVVVASSQRCTWRDRRWRPPISTESAAARW